MVRRHALPTGGSAQRAPRLLPGHPSAIHASISPRRQRTSLPRRSGAGIAPESTRRATWRGEQPRIVATCFGDRSERPGSELRLSESGERAADVDVIRAPSGGHDVPPTGGEAGSPLRARSGDPRATSGRSAQGESAPEPGQPRQATSSVGATLPPRGPRRRLELRGALVHGDAACLACSEHRRTLAITRDHT